MEAIILCGGLAKRMRPISEDTPKALVEINGKTILRRQMEHLRKYGVDRFVLAVGHLSDKFIGSENVIISKDDDVGSELIGTAGAVRKALKHIKGDEFYVINGDDLSDLDFSKMSANTIALSQFRCPYGLVATHGDDVVGFEEKPMIKDAWVSMGAYCFNRDIYFPERGSLEKDVFPNSYLKAYKHRGFWLPINSIKDLEEAEKVIK